MKRKLLRVEWWVERLYVVDAPRWEFVTQCDSLKLAREVAMMTPSGPIKQYRAVEIEIYSPEDDEK